GVAAAGQVLRQPGEAGVARGGGVALQPGPLAAGVEQRRLADGEAGDAGTGHAAPDPRDLAPVLRIAVAPAGRAGAAATGRALEVGVVLRACERAVVDQVEIDAAPALRLRRQQVVDRRLPHRGGDVDAAQVRRVEAEQPVLVHRVVVAVAARVVEAQQ